MRRREFLHLAAAGLLSAACQPRVAPAPDKPRGALDGLTVIDIHAHPNDRSGDGMARIADLRAGGVTAACFAVVGDRQWSRGRLREDSEFQAARQQLRAWLNGPLADGRVALVRTAGDIPAPGAARPGAILALEGGDPLEGRVERVDEFHALGVRLITLVHYRNNELGDMMKERADFPAPGPFRNGLSPVGRAVVARMERLGLVVDVAHASPATLRDILAVAEKPVIDSHTAPCRRGDPGTCGRRRTWPEMEAVVAGGGVVCSWAMGSATRPWGFAEWAQEIMEMQARLGAAGVGLGTDNGGIQTAYVSGYSGWRDLDKLAEALAAAGMGREDMAAFFGGNVRRILAQCLG